MAQVIRYIDPDASGVGNGTSWTDAYTSMQGFNSAEAKDLPEITILFIVSHLLEQQIRRQSCLVVGQQA